MPDIDVESFSEDSAEETKVYWTALGRFIHYFSQVEQKLQNLLWQLTGTSLEVARAAFQDARHGTIVTLINRINTSHGRPEHPSYRIAVERLGPIARMRNDIVHLAPTLEAGSATISTTKRAMPGRGVEMVVSAQLLDDMSRDLLMIMAHLRVFNLEMQENADPLTLEYWQMQTQAHAWLYKPRPQSSKAQLKARRSSHSNPEAQALPPPPSDT